MGQEGFQHLPAADNEVFQLVVLMVHPGAPGRGVAVDPIDGHDPVQIPDLPVEPQPQGVGLVGKAVAVGHMVKVLGVFQDLRPGGEGAGVIGLGRPGQDQLHGQVPVLSVVQQGPVRGRAVAKMQQRVVHTGAVVRVALQKVHLPLQAAVVAPVVVPFADADVLAPGVGEEVFGVEVAALGENVLLHKKGPHNAGVTQGIVPDDLRRAVGGGVVADQDLKGEVRLLAQKAVQGLGNVLLMIIGRAQDGHHAAAFFHV